MDFSASVLVLLELASSSDGGTREGGRAGEEEEPVLLTGNLVGWRLGELRCFCMREKRRRGRPVALPLGGLAPTCLLFGPDAIVAPVDGNIEGQEAGADAEEQPRRVGAVEPPSRSCVPSHIPRALVPHQSPDDSPPAPDGDPSGRRQDAMPDRHNGGAAAGAAIGRAEQAGSGVVSSPGLGVGAGETGEGGGRLLGVPVEGAMEGGGDEDGEEEGFGAGAEESEHESRGY